MKKKEYNRNIIYQTLTFYKHMKYILLICMIMSLVYKSTGMLYFTND